MSGDLISATFRLGSPSLTKSCRSAALRYAEGATTRTDFFSQRGLPDALVEKFKYGVVVDPEPEHKQFVGRISIPYKNAQGIHYLVFRCPCLQKECVECANGQFKYLASDGEYRPLYNSWVLDRDLDVVYVSEGEFNADVATFVGFPCIGTGSATRMEAHWTYLFDGLEEVVILKDGDGDPKAGKNMVRLWRRHLSKETRVGLRVIEFPKGHDVASYFQAFGANALKAYISPEQTKAPVE